MTLIGSPFSFSNVIIPIVVGLLLFVLIPSTLVVLAVVPSRRRRAVALLIDTVILVIALLVVTLVATLAIVFTAIPSASQCGPATSNGQLCGGNASVGVSSGLLWLVLLLIPLYFWVLSSTGGTAGQHIVELRVVDTTTGRRIGFCRGALRLVGIRRDTAIVHRPPALPVGWLPVAQRIHVRGPIAPRFGGGSRCCHSAAGIPLRRHGACLRHPRPHASAPYIVFRAAIEPVI